MKVKMFTKKMVAALLVVAIASIMAVSMVVSVGAEVCPHTSTSRVSVDDIPSGASHVVVENGETHYCYITIYRWHINHVCNYCNELLYTESFSRTDHSYCDHR